MIAPTYLVSSIIDAIGFKHGRLFIRFKSGGAYAYDNVPYTYFSMLKTMESAGRFFHKNIRSKPQFKHHKLEYDPFVGDKP